MGKNSWWNRLRIRTHQYVTQLMRLRLRGNLMLHSSSASPVPIYTNTQDKAGAHSLKHIDTHAPSIFPFITSRQLSAHTYTGIHSHVAPMSHSDTARHQPELHKVLVLGCHPIDNPITAEKGSFICSYWVLGVEEAWLIIKAGFARLMVKWAGSEFKETLGLWHVLKAG